jgi:hypothetical protein
MQLVSLSYNKRVYEKNQKIEMKNEYLRRSIKKVSDFILFFNFKAQSPTQARIKYQL